MNDIEKILRDCAVLQEGHFLLTSGLHSGFYFQKFRILEHPNLVSRFARKIAENFKDKKIDTVCGPTTGGIIIAFEVARQLGGQKLTAGGRKPTAGGRQTVAGARCIFAEKSETGRSIGRGVEIKPGERILVVDDVLTTGGSIKETLEALKPFSGEVAGIAVFIDRSEKVEWDIPLFAVYRHPVVNYSPDNCPLCKAGVPLSVLGGKSKK
jgi:orotate phosphoribosyltransferase